MKQAEPSAIYFAAGLTALMLATGLLVALTAESFFRIMPCELCLAQRWPYYIGASLALILSTLAHYRRVSPLVLRIGMIALIGVLCWSLYLAVQHSGVEWGWWPAPEGCRTNGDITIDVKDLFAQLKVSRPVPCDVPSWKLFELVSFANLNAMLSALLLVLNVNVLAGVNPRKLLPQGSSTESQ